MALTDTQYLTLQAAFDHFNMELFGGSLPQTLITLQRHKGARGYFWRDRFASRPSLSANAPQSASEIALNPDEFAGRTDQEILSTLVHEMVHHWQAEHGTMPRTGYHDRQWASKMREVGLHPSTTGAPGGRETGPSVTHYIVVDGPFDCTSRALLRRGGALFWQSAATDDAAKKRAKKKAASKTKFTCAGCEANAWGVSTLHLTCTDCEMPMLAADAEDGND